MLQYHEAPSSEEFSLNGKFERLLTLHDVDEQLRNVAGKRMIKKVDN
jgi:hypothetical protein